MTTIAEHTDLDRTRFFIDGEWVEPRGSETHRALEAATGEPLGTAALATDADIDAAVKAARRALDHGPWGRTTAAERAEAMHRFAAALAGLLQMYAEIIKTLPLEEVRPSQPGATIVRREPVGVVGAIAPWNYPQVLAMMKIAPALAAGCTLVLKPSPETALDSYIMGDAAQEAGLPPGVLNIVLGGREAGASLVSHPNVDKIAFTGSTATGRIIGAECGRLIRRVTLELGGKSAAIFLEDGDVDTFIAGLGMASFMNNSQTCTTQSRILVARSRYDEVVEAVAEYTRNQVIDIARHSNARLVSGGGRPAGQDRGWFVEPTVFADVDNSDRLAREEVFGPVMAMIPFGDDDDAVAIANDSNYGLGGSVWTTDEQRGIDVSRRVRTGTIGVNYYLLDLGSPFGGMKDSGIGRELGPEALNSYLEYKSIYASADQLNS
ncbi:MAG: aldehyde dehydrogenase [Streptosporangiaceae bacterium]